MFDDESDVISTLVVVDEECYIEVGRHLYRPQ
jgi:hypothetical protein